MRAWMVQVAVATALPLGLSALLFAAPVGGDPTGSVSPPVPTPTQCSVATSMTLVLTGAPVSATMTESCPFAPGTPVDISYLGTTDLVIPAPANGLITLDLSATDPHLDIDSTGWQTANYGPGNVITGTGVNSSGGSNTATFIVDISIPATAATTTGPTGGSSGLAFTGADLTALVAAGLALLVLGAVIVLYARRRAAAQALPVQPGAARDATPARLVTPDPSVGPPGWSLHNVW